MVCRNHLSLWQRNTVCNQMISLPMLAPLCPVWIEESFELHKSSEISQEDREDLKDKPEAQVQKILELLQPV